MATPKKKEWAPCCDAMSRNFEATSHGKGIRLVIIFNMKTGVERYAFIHKLSAKEKGSFLNFCPWCGLKFDCGSIPEPRPRKKK